MSPLEYYRQQCSDHSLCEDKQQLFALQYMQKIYMDLLQEHAKRAGFFSFLRKPSLIQGLYLWGSVGIGKTFLMDCFYQCVPFKEKMRIHFHQFMHWLHQELKKHQGQKEPLHIIAQELAQKHLLICFDEFFVSDIADAMLLGRFLAALFSQGVCLMLTSNVVPDELYKNGLQRQLFLPTIAALKRYTTIVHLATATDYRLRYLKNAGVFHTPNNDIAYQKMESIFSIMTHNKMPDDAPIHINARLIQIKKQVDDVIWFDFNVICNKPRSQHDYLAIAKKYKIVFISDIPIIPSYAKDTICLFIRLVDVFYDARIRLVFSAATCIEEIYTEGSMLFDYARTRSRLLEMQSEKYLAKNQC